MSEHAEWWFDPETMDHWGSDRWQQEPPRIAVLKITRKLHRGECLVTTMDGDVRLESPLWRRLLHRTGAFERLPDGPEEPGLPSAP